MTAAAGIPQEVLSDAVADAIDGRRLIAAAFLTFEFDPGFFEQEILPSFLNIPRGPTRNLKLLALEDALAHPERHIAVYYDRNGLRESDSGSAHLDVRRIPVSLATGIFHPKNVLVLVEDRIDPDIDAEPEQALLVITASANLTRSGWWRNVEASDVEEIRPGERTRLVDGLDRLIDWLLGRGPKDTDQKALLLIREFLRRHAAAAEHRTWDAVLRPHFFVKGLDQRLRSDELPDPVTLRDAVERRSNRLARFPLLSFLDDVCGRDLDGMNIEVLSPYLDKAPTSLPLAALVEHFGPNELRVLLPRDNHGDAALTPELHKWLPTLQGASWGRLPRELTRLGKRDDAGERFVHAKVYRFFRSGRSAREVLVIGSINLTWPAHQNGGNLETAVVIEHEPDPAVDFWLVPERGTPGRFVDPATTEDDSATDRGSPLLVRYAWATGRAEVRWEAPEPSRPLTLSVHGVTFTQLASLTPRAWTPLEDAAAAHLKSALRATSFVTVDDGLRRATVLVQEEGMAHKPSLVTDLAVEDILRYWALLTPEQRAEYLAERVPAGETEDGVDLLTAVRPVASPDRLFSQFAGIFHAFARIEAEIVGALEAGRERDAEYRLFGAKFDSLGSLLARVASETSMDLIERYVVALCARQLRDLIRTRFESYWQAHTDAADRLDASLTALDGLEADVLARNDDTMPRFVAWFRRRFLRRSARVPQ